MLTSEEFLKKYSKNLNESQRKAVQTINGPVLLLAVPGSGKTTVLVNRLGYMLYVEGIDPSNILTLTYTVEATKDMARRFESVFGKDYSGQIEFRTINGICSKIIYKYGQIIGKTAFNLVSEENNLGKIITGILANYLSEYPTESEVKIAGTLITYCKNMMLRDDEIKELGDRERLPLLEVFKDYNAYLRSHGLMDYDDQMIYAYRILKNMPDLLKYYQEQYRYICVDEAQDTSKIQHVIIGLLAGKNGNLFMVGDEDQSIYGFRAAYPEALLNFEHDHPDARVLVMDKNYRSNAKIVDAADRFIQHNKSRHDKHMVAVRDAEADVEFVKAGTREDQYSYLLAVAENCNTQTAVLYRDNECALPLIDMLERQGIPYRIKGVDMTFFTHRIVNDVTNIMKFAMNPKDTALFMRIYSRCKTYLQKKDAEQMCRLAQKQGSTVLKAAYNVVGRNRKLYDNCLKLEANLNRLVNESPSKALYIIEHTIGYGSYLDSNGSDSNKMFILRQLANNEETLTGFLQRLDYLQELLKYGQPNYDCPFILSTIHSAKGLEYDRVFLIDAFNGLFPTKVVKSSKKKTLEMATFEEERRLFYVGMTRAKNKLYIFKLGNRASCFIKETALPVTKNADDGSDNSTNDETLSETDAPATSQLVGMLESDYPLAEGEAVVSSQYGQGVVTNVKCDDAGRINKFKVKFETIGTKTFSFPIAFQKSLRLLNGAEVKIKVRE